MRKIEVILNPVTEVILDGKTIGKGIGAFWDASNYINVNFKKGETFSVSRRGKTFADRLEKEGFITKEDLND